MSAKTDAIKIPRMPSLPLHCGSGQHSFEPLPVTSIKQETLPRLLAVEIRLDTRSFPDTGGGAGCALDQGRALSHLRAISLGLIDRILPVAALRHANRHHGRCRGY